MSAIVAYVLTSALWAFGGLIVGYLLGRVASWRRPIVVVEQEEPVRTRTRTDSIISAIVVVMAVVSVGVGAVSVARQQTVTECQAEFNAQFSSALTERVNAANEERAGQRAWMSAALSGDQVAARKAAQSYVDALNRADQQRDQHPLPPQPQC